MGIGIARQWQPDANQTAITQIRVSAPGASLASSRLGRGGFFFGIRLRVGQLGTFRRRLTQHHQRREEHRGHDRDKPPPVWMAPLPASKYAEFLASPFRRCSTHALSNRTSKVKQNARLSSLAKIIEIFCKPGKSYAECSRFLANWPPARFLLADRILYISTHDGTFKRSYHRRAKGWFSMPGAFKGRGAAIRPANPHLPVHTEADLQHVAWDDEYLSQLDRPPTQYFPDESQSIVAENDSPDVGFRYSVNPYRGCLHGCSYCYARPTHEYLGLSAGLDFETKVFVKHRAAELFRDFLVRPAWRPETIAFSGVTDCYQPAEREFRLTRGCVAVAAEFRQPIGIITKNALVTRDIDLLKRLAAHNAVCVSLSITTLDAELARLMEPRTSSPEARLRALRELSEAGIATNVMVAPVIPGLNDSEMPAILTAARQAGAQSAGYVLLKLPTTVRQVFTDWLRRSYPDRAGRIEALIRSTRGGKLNDSEFGRRQVGTGQVAEVIADTFRIWTAKLGYADDHPRLNRAAFRPLLPTTGQRRLF
jgi:DNA repair photolyase